MSPRQLVRILCNVYYASDDEVGSFIENFSEIEGLMDTPVKALPRQQRERLALGLFYGLPCDFYLFDDQFKVRNIRMKEKVHEAFLQRGRGSGMVLATSSTKYVKEFGGIAGILHHGQLCFFEDVDEAIAVFERLPVEPRPILDLSQPLPLEDEEDEI
jgi:capsular polysaccharide transport system ATP-binding protein